MFLMLTSGGNLLQLTNEEGGKLVITFSLDGKEVYYYRFLGRDEVWAVPTLGGLPAVWCLATQRFPLRMAHSFIMRSLISLGFFVQENPD